MVLSARSILITGASRGLGLEFVKQILALPSAPEVLIAACRSPGSADKLQDIAKSNSKVKVIKLDVEKDEDIENAVKEIQAYVGDQGLNLLINNAGLYDETDEGGVYKVTRERMQRHFDVNVSAPLIIAQKMLPLIKKAAQRKQSKQIDSQAGIVMMSSIQGSQGTTYAGGRGGISLHYKCSKTAATMAAILLSRELKNDGIYVTSIHPGWVKTDMGGPNADLTVEQSIAGCLKVLGSASEETNGKLVDYSGKILPY